MINDDYEVDMCRIDLEKLTLIGIYLVAAGIVISQVLGFLWMVSNLFYISFLLVFIFWIISLIRYPLRRSDILVGAIILLSLLSALIGALVSSVSVSFEYMKKLVIFWSTVLFFQTACKVSVGGKAINIIQSIVILVSIFLALCYFVLDKNILYAYQGVVIKYLTFGFTNPNLTAQFFVCMICD